MLPIDHFQSVVGSSPTHPGREALLFETVVLYMELLASYNLVHTPLKGFVINHKKENLLQTEHEVAKCVHVATNDMFSPHQKPAYFYLITIVTTTQIMLLAHILL